MDDLPFEPDLAWVQRDHGRIHIDSLLLDHLNRSIYRYATEQETETLVNHDEWWFDRPTCWKDKYEQHIASRLFGAGGVFDDMGVYAKCFTFEYTSEPMWRLNKDRIRLAFTVGKLIDTLSVATGIDGGQLPKLYIGRARYMGPTKIRSAIDGMGANRPQFKSRLAAASLLMKRIGFHYENEIRMCFIFEPRTLRSDYLKIRIKAPVNAMLVDPYMEANKFPAILGKYRALGYMIDQSKFDLDPSLHDQPR
jgi:hypothetical protein